MSLFIFIPYKKRIYFNTTCDGGSIIEIIICYYLIIDKVLVWTKQIIPSESNYSVWISFSL